MNDGVVCTLVYHAIRRAASGAQKKSKLDLSQLDVMCNQWFTRSFEIVQKRHDGVVGQPDANLAVQTQLDVLQSLSVVMSTSTQDVFQQWSIEECHISSSDLQTSRHRCHVRLWTSDAAGRFSVQISQSLSVMYVTDITVRFD